MAIPSVLRTKEVTEDLFIFSLSSPDIPLIWQVFWSGYFISFLTCHRSYYYILGVIRTMISPVTLLPECAIPSAFTEFAQFNMGFAVPSWGWSQPVEPFEWLIVQPPSNRMQCWTHLAYFFWFWWNYIFSWLFPPFLSTVCKYRSTKHGSGPEQTLSHMAGRIIDSPKLNPNPRNLSDLTWQKQTTHVIH